MKAIISHDIDHITVSEHLLADLIVPKFIFRSKIELLSGKISIKEYLCRWAEIFNNKWQNVDELITYNKMMNIPSSFFMGVAKGTGLNYNNELAAVWAEQILNRNAKLHIHGIKFDSFDGVLEEKQLFEKVFNHKAFGMRMHYVKRNEQTLNHFSKAGYVFDSTVHAMENPYKVGDMWEFPFQIMDGWIIENRKKWQTRNLEQCKDATKKIIETAQSKEISYLGIDFHDRYFNKSFKTWLDWYMWLTEYLKSNKIECVDFLQAIQELETKHVEHKII